MKQGLTLNELAAELTRRQEAKRDYMVDARRIDFTTEDNVSRVTLVGSGADEFSSGLQANDLFHEQIGAHLKVPKKYYEYIRTNYSNVLDYTVNNLLHDRDERRMIRTLDGTARAFLSDRYLRRDDYDLAQVVLPILHEIPDVRIRSSALTERRFYLKATTPKVTEQIKVGTEICAGVYVANSEVGCGALEIFPFIETLACSNGMIVRREGAGMMRRVHLGRRIEANDAAYAIFSDATLRKDDEAFFAMCADVVRAAVSEVNFRELIAQMAAAAQDTPVEHPIAAVALLSNRTGLSEEEGESVLKYLSLGGDFSRWGVLSAVTRTAEDVESYDRATELEMLGGKMLDYSPTEWRPIATAV